MAIKSTKADSAKISEKDDNNQQVTEKLTTQNNQPRKPAEIDAFIGKRIKLRRMSLGLSQQEIADRLGISYQQVQKYETGLNRISASKLFRVAEVLHTSLDFYFEGMNPALGSLVNSTGISVKSIPGIEDITGANLRHALVELIDAINQSTDKQIIEES